MKIYLDNAATTKIDNAVFDELQLCLREYYANPSSVHSMGQAAAAKVENAREICAAAINCKPNEIIFTGGGTESDNMAIIGFAKANRSKGKHIITTQIEHHAVLLPCRYLEKEGFDITYLPVDENGLLNIRSLKEAIRDDTILISVMHANNEIGTIQPIKEIGEIARKKKIAFHSDCVQTFCKLPIDVKTMNIDMMSISAHKFYGPKGVGFFYVKNGIRFDPILLGGNQENSRRAGTVNAAMIVALAKAIEVARSDTESGERIKFLRDHLSARVLNEIADTTLNGSDEYRIYENANFCFGDIATDALLYALDLRGIYASAGSACTAGTIEVSHVIHAIGREHCGASLRFSLSKYTTVEEIDLAVDILKEVVVLLRKI